MAYLPRASSMLPSRQFDTFGWQLSATLHQPFSDVERCLGTIDIARAGFVSRYFLGVVNRPATLCQVLCRFSDAGNDDLTVRCGNWRPKRARARKTRTISPPKSLLTGAPRRVSAAGTGRP